MHTNKKYVIRDTMIRRVEDYLGMDVAEINRYTSTCIGNERVEGGNNAGNNE